MCSLKEAGFSGRHKCGVTLLSGHFSIFISFISIRHFLLSGPESREVVLVSAAHCNFVCKVLWRYLVIWWLKGLALKTCFDSTQRNNVTEGLDNDTLFCIYRDQERIGRETFFFSRTQKLGIPWRCVAVGKRPLNHLAELWVTFLSSLNHFLVREDLLYNLGLVRPSVCKKLSSSFISSYLSSFFSLGNYVTPVAPVTPWYTPWPLTTYYTPVTLYYTPLHLIAPA